MACCSSCCGLATQVQGSVGGLRLTKKAPGKGGEGGGGEGAAQVDRQGELEEKQRGPQPCHFVTSPETSVR